MTDPISPIGGAGGVGGPRPVTGRARSTAAIGRDRSPKSPTMTRGLPMVIGQQPKPSPPRSRRAALAAFAAQLMGQGGQKRGLRGGPETLDKARSAYLETEWSGPSDRRPRPGRITKTDI